MVHFQQSLEEDLKQEKLRQQLQNVDSIIATRQRRANAGNRLQSLLNAETPLIEEDETTNDIFREIEDDDDFEINEAKGALESDVEEEEEEKESPQPGSNKRQSESNASRRSKRVETATLDEPNSSADSDIDQKDDDMFSDSADSDSEDADEDEEHGEKELLKQQREERRRIQKKKRDALSSMPAALIKAQQRQKHQARVASENEEAEIERLRLLKRQRTRLSAANLMSENRRSSTRKAAVKNKEDVIQRLKESEARRAKQPTPTTKVVHQLTQEERLAEAVITEKKNIESLHSFYEQEEDRRKKQRAALLAKRVPMISFIRYISKATLEPATIPKPFIEEITQSPATKPKRDWKKRKENAKVKDEKEKSEGNSTDKADPEDAKAEPGPESTGGNETVLKAELSSEAPLEEAPKPDPPTESRRSMSVEQMEADYIIFGEDDQEKKEEVKTADKEPEDVPKNEKEPEVVADEPSTNPEENVPVKLEKPQLSVESEEPSFYPPEESLKPADDEPVEPGGLLSEAKESALLPDEKTLETEEKPAQDLIEPAVGSEEPSAKLEDAIENEKPDVLMTDESLHPEVPLVKETTHELEEEHRHIDPSKLVVEGPAVCRALTTISLMEFPHSFHYTVPEIKTTLFGPQSLEIPVIPDRTAMKPYPTSAAATQAILRAKVGGGAAQPGAQGRKRKNESAKSTPTKRSLLGGPAGRGIFGAVGGTSSSILNTLSGGRAATGAAGLGVRTPTASLALTTTPVAPATAATPTGASAAATLANAGIPKCVVTGKPCKFVDPRTGIPYSSMEAFQIIRTVTNNTVPWSKDFGVYIAAIGSRHAKGVPAGFGDPVGSMEV